MEADEKFLRSFFQKATTRARRRIQKGFCGAFSLKKRPLRRSAPRARRRKPNSKAQTVLVIGWQTIAVEV